MVKPVSEHPTAAHTKGANNTGLAQQNLDGPVESRLLVSIKHPTAL